MTFKVLVSLLMCIALSTGVFAQNYSVYGGYFLNPYTYNPAEAATSYLHGFLSYRKQWLGITGAPQISAIGFSTMLDNTRAGVGFKASSFRRGLLNTSEATATFAYGVPLDRSSRLFFGLSGGAIMNNIDWSMISDPSDVALGAIPNSTQATGSFGMLYRNSSGFNLGFSLPKLVGSSPLESKQSFSPFDNIVFSTYYSHRPPEKSATQNTKAAVKKKGPKTKYSPFEAYLIYRYSKLGSQLELTGKMNVGGYAWLAASYRQSAGIIPSVGLNLNRLSLSYFYEFGLGGDIPLKTHEVWLGLSIGNEKKFREKLPPVIAKRPVTTTTNKTTTPTKTNTQPTKTTSHPTKISTTQPQNQTQTQTQAVTTNQNTQTQNQTQTVTKPTTPVDTAALHAREREELQKHIDDHKDGTHDDAHDHPINERHEFAKRGTHHEELEEGTHIITGAFSSRANAEHFAKNLKALGYAGADFGHLSVKNLWYVFLAEEDDIETAKKERNRLQKNKMFKDVWLLTVHQ